MATATTVAKWGLTRYQHIRIIILPPSLTSLGKMHARVHGLNNITTSMGIWLESANPILYVDRCIRRSRNYYRHEYV